MTRTWSHWLALALPALLLSAAGCGQTAVSSESTPAAETPAQTSPQEAAPEAVAAKPAKAEVAVEIATGEAILKYIADRGQVVVMDCWNTSCDPCKRDFHHLVELHHELGDKLTCVSLSFDYIGIGKPEDAKGPVLEFLQSQKATCKNFLGAEPDDQLYPKFELDSVPAVLVFNKQGKLVKKFSASGGSDAVPYDQVKAMAKELLK